MIMGIAQTMAICFNGALNQGHFRGESRVHGPTTASKVKDSLPRGLNISQSTSRAIFYIFLLFLFYSLD
jgi:hypothetical protein